MRQKKETKLSFHDIQIVYCFGMKCCRLDEKEENTLDKLCHDENFYLV